MTYPPLPGEENTDRTLGSPAAESANQVFVYLIRSFFNMDVKFELGAECANSSTGSSLISSFTRTIAILTAAGFHVIASTTTLPLYSGSDYGYNPREVSLFLGIADEFR